jgi:nucleotide-binding universal stress UspA family protein
MLPIRTILHPTDFSEGSAYAFRTACSLAHDYEARLLLVHVRPPVVIYGNLPPVPAEPAEILRKEPKLLDRMQPPDPEVPVERHLVTGDPAAEILRLARTEKCDLIVMGTRGLTGLDRLLLGSVAEQVLRRAPCPVLTVKATPVPVKPDPKKAEQAVAVTTG